MAEEKWYLKITFSQIKQILLLLISWSIGFYLFRHSITNIDLSAPDKISIYHLILLGIGLFFIFLPFLKKIKIGGLVEIEREIAETKAEVKDFKSEVRNSISMISTSVSTSLGNLSNQVTVHTSPQSPSIDLLRKEIKKVITENSDNSDSSINAIKNELILEDEDTIMSLARTRIIIESLLRKILHKKSDFEGKSEEIKYLPIIRLYKMFLESYPQYEYLSKSFRYVQNICNGAIHGQKVSEGQAIEALELGARIIGILRDIQGD